MSGAVRLDERIAEAALRAPDHVALVCGDARTTFAELMRAIEALAAAYRGFGLRHGDRVLCQMSNRAEHIVAMAAAWRIGAIHVGIDHELTAGEVDRLITLTDAAAIVHEPCVGAADPLAVPLAVTAAHPAVALFTVGVAGGPYTSLEALLERGIDDAAVGAGGAGHAAKDGSLSAADPAVILLTSGTTGVPKTPIGRHADLAEGWDGFAEELAFGTDDVHLGHLPLTHGFGMSLAYMAMATGGRLVLMPRFEARDALRLIQQERITVFSGSPAHFILLTKKLDAGDHDVSTLRTGIGSASAFPPPLLRRIFDDLGMELMLMYGSSEGAGVVTTDRADMLLGAAGRPVPGYVAIVGRDHQPLPTGEIGEIAFNRGVGDVEYFSSAGTPDGALAGDWYYSGDLGRLDDEGRLYVLGRLKHQIDRGGLKVDPGEVEQALLRLPAVLDAAVIGTANPVLGETVCACVVPCAGEPVTLDDVRAALRSELAPYKLPEELCLLEALPRTALGKVDRTALRASVEAGDRQRLRVG